MIDFFIDLFSSFYNLLPNSFIQSMDLLSKENMASIADFLNYVNWMIPFDIASRVMGIWLPCILAYYVFDSLQDIVKKLLKIFLDNI